LELLTPLLLVVVALLIRLVLLLYLALYLQQVVVEVVHLLGKAIREVLVADQAVVMARRLI
jgi:hypothetical protein